MAGVANSSLVACWQKTKKKTDKDQVFFLRTQEQGISPFLRMKKETKEKPKLHAQSASELSGVIAASQRARAKAETTVGRERQATPSTHQTGQPFRAPLGGPVSLSSSRVSRFLSKFLEPKHLGRVRTRGVLIGSV